jgi:imidazolonepropionase-like amidohydrolase
VHRKLTLIAGVMACWLVIQGAAHAQKPLAIRGGKIITMAGDTIENGTIVFRDGLITAVGKDVKIPVEARIIDATGKVVMPGFVEAHSSSGMSQANETNPIVPYVSVIDAIDPMNSYFLQARRNGVTSVAITPGNSTLIGGQAAVIKTGGEFIDEMILKPDAGIKISLRPVSGSRMSHMAKLRKAFDDAKAKLDAKNKQIEPKKAADSKKNSGKKSDGKKSVKGDTETKDAAKKKPETKTAAAKPAVEKVDSALDKAMFSLLSGDIPAIIYCDKAMDVGQALRLIEEYGLQAKLVLGRDCYKAAEQIAESGLPVVLDPALVFWEEDPRTKEEKKIVLTKIFGDQKVKFVFQVSRASTPTLGDNYLWYQAATAVKYGMSKQDALEALTILPAKFHGVDKFVGTIETGKDGDVVILSGDPLKVDSWVEKTIVNGEVVYDKKKDKQLRRLLTGENESE